MSVFPASSDPDNEILTYTWTESGSVIAMGANPTVTLSSGCHTMQSKPGKVLNYYAHRQ